MSTGIGVLYLLSVVLLSALVAVVYSAAQDAFAPPSVVTRQALRRGSKLGGVLAGLAILIHFLSKL